MLTLLLGASGGGRSANASALRGGSARRSSRPWLGPGLSFQGSEIAERHDADEAFIAAHYGQAADPPTPHLFRHFLDTLALETIQHIGGHRLANGGLSRVQALSRNLHGNLMSGDRSDQQIVFADRERPGIDVRHPTRRRPESFVGACRLKVRCHPAGFFHPTPPSPLGSPATTDKRSIENQSSRS